MKQFGLATVGVDTSFYGLFRIETLDGNYYAIHNMMGYLHSDPDSVDIVTHEETQEPYYVLTYQPGSVVIKTMDILKDNNIIVKVFKEFISRGKVPFYVTYMDINKIFDTCDEFAGASLSDTMEAPTVPISIIARNPNDTTTSIIGKLLMMLIWLIHHLCMFQLSVNFSATSALTKITGSYFYTGVVSAINNPTNQTETIDYILRY